MRDKDFIYLFIIISETWWDTLSPLIMKECPVKTIGICKHKEIPIVHQRHLGDELPLQAN